MLNFRGDAVLLLIIINKLNCLDLCCGYLKKLLTVYFILLIRVSECIGFDRNSVNAKKAFPITDQINVPY
jgi:hypothetical protein